MAILLAVVFQRCNQEDVSSKVEKIKFAISISPSELNPGGKVKVALPPDATVLLTVESSTGDPVLTQHPVKVYAFGSSYVTDPVELAPGNYKITDFLVIDESSTILFAAPKKGSPLAQAVSNPLPRSLHISKNNVANVDVQVLDVNQYTPEDFGYVSFHIEAGSAIRIAVFENIDDQTELTDAKAYILNGTNWEDTLHHYSLKAKVNTVFFAGEPSKEYNLVIVKPNYKTSTFSFTFNELDDAPLKVYLQPRVLQLWYSPHTIPEEPQLARFSVVLGADETAHITVDFRDGTIRDYVIPAGGTIEAARTVATGDYVIRVTGEVQKITTFTPYWEGLVKKIDFSDLTNLRAILPGPLANFAVPTINLYQNRKMEYAYIGGHALDTVYLPGHGTMKYLNISRSPKLSGGEINTMIEILYSGVIVKNVTNGLLDNRSATGDMQGPLSELSLTKLRKMRDTYGWTILPNP